MIKILFFCFFFIIECRKLKNILYINNIISSNEEKYLIYKNKINKNIKKSNISNFLITNRKELLTFPNNFKKYKSKCIFSYENKNNNIIDNKNENIIENKNNNIIENKNDNIIENKNENIIENKNENIINDIYNDNIIERKIEEKKNEIINKVKLPIYGKQLKPEGGYTKEILDLIKQSNDYINIINKEIINKKIKDKINENDLSFFDTEETLEEHEINYLNKIYEQDYILNIYNLLSVWNKRKNIELSVFVSKINNDSNILPGERTLIKFTEIEKAEYIKKIKKNKNVCIAMIFVDNKNKDTNENDINKNENINEQNAIEHNLYPIGILSHPLNISNLDKTGEISVLNLFRFKINNYRITDNDFLVNSQLYIDNKDLNNLELTLENQKIVLNLYDKIMNLKIKYYEKIGNNNESEKLKCLEKITDRIDEYINVININKEINIKKQKLNFFTKLFLEYVSFLPLDINATIDVKLQLMYSDNTELRFHNIKNYLLQIYNDYKYKLKGL